MDTKLSFQMQLLHDPTLDLGFIRQVRPRWIKYHQPDPNRTRELLDVVDRVCLRFFDISEEFDKLARDPQRLGREHGEFAGRTLRQEWRLDDGRLARLGMEGLNEPPVANREEADRVNAYGMAFAEAAAQHGVPVATPNLSTGWPYNHGTGTPPDYEPFRGLVEVLRATGSFWASHEYCDLRGPDSDDWLWNMGRILQRPAWMKGNGFKALITECGADEAVNAPPGTPHQGWNGRISGPEYAANFLGVYDWRMQADPDVEALMVFLLDTDNPPAWWTFDVAPLRQEIVDHVAWIRNQPEPAGGWSIYLPGVVKGEAELDPQPEGGGQRFLWLFRQAGEEFRQPWYLLAGIAYVESRFNPAARGAAGEQGMMQFMPATWAEEGPKVKGKDPNDPRDAVRAAGNYLRWMRAYLAERHHGDLRWALAAYNWGIGRVVNTDSWDQVPQAVQGYVDAVFRAGEVVKSWVE